MRLDELRLKALEIAAQAHAPHGISALLLIQEAQRIAAYIEKGDEFLPKDANKPD